MTLYRDIKTDCGILVQCTVCGQLFQYHDLLVLSDTSDLQNTILFGCPYCHSALSNITGVIR